MRGKTVRTFMLPVVLALLVAVALPVAAGEDGGKADGHKVVAKIHYKTDEGREPLAAVPVHLVYPDGSEVTKCTNAKGRVAFKDVPAGNGYMLYAGPTHEKTGEECKNWKFRNPDTKKLMFMVSWGASGSTHGVAPTDTFAVGAADQGKDGTDTKVATARTPSNTRRVCDGFKTTMQGDAKPNFMEGTLNRDIIHGGRGDDVIDGLCGNDILCGGPGNDLVKGSNGDDILYGGGGDDILNGGKGEDYLIGGGGNDTCKQGEYLFTC